MHELVAPHAAVRVAVAVALGEEERAGAGGVGAVDGRQARVRRALEQRLEQGRVGLRPAELGENARSAGLAVGRKAGLEEAGLFCDGAKALVVFGGHFFFFFFFVERTHFFKTKRKNGMKCFEQEIKMWN